MPRIEIEYTHPSAEANRHPPTSVIHFNAELANETAQSLAEAGHRILDVKVTDDSGDAPQE